MRLAILRIMTLNLWRDRGALAMAFLLPAIVYVIFAGIFAGASSGDVKVQLAIVDQRQTKESQAFTAALRNHPIVIEAQTVDQLEQARTLVTDGAADVALIVLNNGTGFEELAAGKPPPLLILYDPFREISAKLLEGLLQESYFNALPSASVRLISGLIEEAFFTFEPAQRQDLERGLMIMEERGADSALGELFTRESVSEDMGLPAGVSYYAGAVAMLFLMLSAVNGAMSILDDKESGLFDRITLAPGGVPAYLQGKLVFLWLEGMVAVTVIFTVAWLVFGVDLPRHVLPWLAVSASAALCAAGLALLFVSLCHSRRQAQSLGHIVVLVISAVGGSMVPRFLMPPAVQDLGWLTPNTWVLEAYSSVFWERDALAVLDLPLYLLIGVGLTAGVIAMALQYRRSVNH